MRRWWLMLLVALPALAERDAGLVWSGLDRGWSASNAIHNSAGTSVVGNTRGPIQNVDAGVASNGTATAAWVGLGTNFNPLAGATEATLSVWVRIAAPTIATFPVWGNDPSSGATGTVGWVIMSATRQYCYWHGTKFTNYVYFDKSGLPTIHRSNWVHLATTWRASTTNVQLYIDGQSMTVTPIRVGVNVPQLDECNTEWRIGAFANAGASGLMNGNAVRYGRVWRRALSTNEVRALYVNQLKEIR